MLVLESSTYRGTVALLRGEDVLASQQVAMRGAHEERLMPAVAHVLTTTGVSIGEVERVVCGAGPGSFTSLRIAAAIAKGLVQPSRGDALRRPQLSGTSMVETRHDQGAALAAVSSLVLIVAGVVEQLEPGAYVAALDALRGERYGMLLSVVDDGSARVGTNNKRRLRIDGTRAWRRLSVPELERWADDVGATILGPGYARDAWPIAAGARWVPEWIEEVDAVTWQPDYGRLAEAEVRRTGGGESLGAGSRV